MTCALACKHVGNVPQLCCSIWFTRKLLPDLYGPMTTIGAIGPSSSFKAAKPAGLIFSLVLEGSGSTRETLKCILRTLDVLDENAVLWGC